MSFISLLVGQGKHLVISRVPSYLRTLFLSPPREFVWSPSGDKTQPEMLTNWDTTWEGFMLPGHNFQQKHQREWTFKHGLDRKCKSCISAASFGTVKHWKFCPSLFLIHETLGSLSMQRFWATAGNWKWTFPRQACGLPDFQTNRLYWRKWCENRLNRKPAQFRLSSVAQKRCMLKPPCCSCVAVP